MPTVVATDFNGKPSPFVDVAINYVWEGERREGEMRAILDSGASMPAMMSGSLLPPDVEYARLPILKSNIHWHAMPKDGANPIEYRVWRAELRVFGVMIATDAWVTPPGDNPPHLVLGLAGLFRHFMVSFAWSNVPPLFHLEPVGQLANVTGAMPAIGDRPVARWGGPDGAYWLQQGDGSPIPRIAAPATALLEAGERTKAAPNLAIRPKRRRTPRRA